MTFEERLARLEEIAASLEGEGVELARALELFDEGVQLLRAATKDLASAEVKVQKLIERADGTFGTTDLRD